MILAAVSLLVLSLPVPVMAASFNLTPTSGPPGTVVNVIGSGYVNGESYQIIFAPGTSYQTYLPSASPISVNGTTFSTPVTIPNAPFGLYTIRVSATTSGNLEQNFNLTAKVSLNNSSGNVGDTVLVSGSGFRSSVPVFIFFNNNQVVSSSTDIYGTMTPVSFTIPAIKAATYFVYGTDGEAVSSSAGFTVRQLLRTEQPGDGRRHA